MYTIVSRNTYLFVYYMRKFLSMYIVHCVHCNVCTTCNLICITYVNSILISYFLRINILKNLYGAADIIA